MTESQPRESLLASRSFRKGDKVIESLRGAGFTEREEGVIAFVRKGVAHVDNGPGNDTTTYDAQTGKWIGHDFGGFTRWIELAS